MTEPNSDNIVPIKKSDLARMIEEDISLEETGIESYSSDEKRILEQMNQKHAFVRDYAGSPRVLVYIYDDLIGKKRIAFQSVDSFYLWYMNQTVPVMMGGKVMQMEMGKWWIRHVDRREYNTVTFDPEHLEKDQYGIHVKNGSINLWSGLGVEPKKGNWKHLRKHIWLVLCNKDKAKFKYVMRWMAWSVQNPGKPAEVAIVFKGKKGTGKGLIAKTMTSLFGQHGLIVSSRKALTGEFNGHLERSCFVFADEAYYPGDKEVEGIIKALITEPTLFLEGKHKDGRNVKNCLKIMMASNNDWVVPASSDERRFFINEVDGMYATDGVRSKVRDAYFNRVFKEIENGGKQAFIYSLLNFDLKGWHPRTGIPETTELQKQVFHSHGYAVKALYEFLQNGIFPGDRDKLWVKGSTLWESVEKYFPEVRKASTVAKKDALEQIGVKKTRAAKGNVWHFGPLHKMRANWIKAYGTPPEPFLPDEKGEEVWKFEATEF